MTMFNLIAELNEKRVTEDRADELVTALEGYSPSVSPGTAGRPHITISLPADTLRQAFTSGLAVIESAAGSPATAVEVLPTADFDSRNGLEPVPELLSVTQVAAALGQSRQAVLKAIDAGRFLSATRVGDTWAISLSEVETRKATIQHERERVPFWYTGVDLTDEQRRIVFDPMYDSLRIVGTVDAYKAYIDMHNGKDHNAHFANIWKTAVDDAHMAIAQLGVKSSRRVDIRPAELPGPTVGAQ